ncbi:hypothetical protein KO353_07570 [Elioraea tepida]|uniref:Uncharacterized protein n=1 Tax=Elioraea tepida TaxID=2843330 RepID=A0A975U5C7_9PROT|nr:hypothetical protein [Elioraea tepida]QXM26038.1 hypothetical protein KO353_07570 [Elioraea tepida]
MSAQRTARGKGIEAFQARSDETGVFGMRGSPLRWRARQAAKKSRAITEAIQSTITA